MGIKIVRTPSETPNITNVDDIIPFRYAYGDQNGYVISRGSELSGSYESGEFTVGSGRAVIQGVEVDIDANGISTTLDTASETRYFKIYLKVNLANDVVVLESYYSTVSYDEITDPTSSDLISGGDAYLLLYTLELNGTVEVEKNKVVKEIEYINPTAAAMKTDFSGNNASQFGDYIVSKKKLLWSGDFEFSSTEKEFTYMTGDSLIGKKIEFVFEQNYINGTYIKDNYFSWYTPNFTRGNEIIISNQLEMDGSFDLYVNISMFRITNQQSGYKIMFKTSGKIYNFQSESRLMAQQPRTHLYKIYEIIE